MAHYGDFNRQPADHVYLSGYGFVSGRDPLHFVERDLRRIAAAAGIALLLLLTFPFLLRRPMEIFASMLMALCSALFGTSGLTAAVEPVREIKEILLYLLSVSVVLLLMRAMLQPPVQQTAPSSSANRSVLCSLMLSAGIGALSVCAIQVQQGILQFCHLVELTPGSPIPTRPAAVFLYLLRIILLPAVFEELLFRGCLLQALRRQGDSFALFFSALCSGLIQYTFTNDLSGFVLGLLFGYVYLRTGSLRTAVGCHLLTNALPVLLEGLQHLLPGDQYTAVFAALLMALLAVGLAGFTLFCRWNHNAFILSDKQGQALPFRRKLRICLTSTPMLAAALLWLVQIVRNMQVIS